MSLKVPKANNIQLFKDGYKVRKQGLLCIPSSSIPNPFPAIARPRGCRLAQHSGGSRTFRPRSHQFRAKRCVPPVPVRISVARASCFPPAGRNKLIINHLGRMFVTSDAATIIREIEVVHPAAKLLVMASQAQESEVRDCGFGCFPVCLTCRRWATLPTSS